MAGKRNFAKNGDVRCKMPDYLTVEQVEPSPYDFAEARAAWEMENTADA